MQVNMGDEEVANIDDQGNELAKDNDKLLIIDADTIAFGACSSCQYVIDKDEIEEDSDTLIYCKVEDMYWDINLEEAITYAQGKIQTIMRRTGTKAENVELHFTSSKNSFRYALLQEAFPNNKEKWYKAHRRNRKASPAGLAEVKRKLGGIFKSFYHTEVEADDVVVHRKMELKDQAILCAIDKDVFNNTPDFGQPHFNYYEAHWFKEPINMKWVSVSFEEARLHQFKQALTGDKSDNIPGLPGIGPKKADKILGSNMDRTTLIINCINAYKKHCNYGEPTAMFLLNMRLVNMHQYDGEKVNLWQIPSYTDEEKE